MENVKVKKGELLAKLKENLKAHVEEFKLAHAAWVEQTIAVHKLQIKSLKETSNTSPDAKFGPVPTSQATSYERAIAMLEMSVEDEIVLDAHEFDQYVLDNWTWSHSFKSVSAAYNNVR